MSTPDDTDDTAPDDPRTATELQRRLAALLRAAHDNGVDVQGAYPLRFDDGVPDWELSVVELRKPEE